MTEVAGFPAEGLSVEEQTYLEDLQRQVQANIGSDESSATEAEFRRRERERISREYSPANPLYQAPEGESHSVVKPKKPEGDKGGSYQKDPRYREFYERLKKQAPQRQPSVYDEEVHPMSLEELNDQAWQPGSKATAEIRFSSASIGRTPQAPPKKPVQQQPAPMPPVPHKGTPSPKFVTPVTSTELGPGMIVHFDDDSIAIYKDAVSGKDYALFYFLEPNGTLSPRGIFIEQYDFKRIGQVSPDLFEQMRAKQTWERDVVVYHLDKFEFSAFIRKLENRTPYPSDAPRSAVQQQRSPTPLERRRPAAERPTTPDASGAGST